MLPHVKFLLTWSDRRHLPAFMRKRTRELHLLFITWNFLYGCSSIYPTDSYAAISMQSGLPTILQVSPWHCSLSAWPTERHSWHYSPPAWPTEQPAWPTEQPAELSWRNDSVVATEHLSIVDQLPTPPKTGDMDDTFSDHVSHKWAPMEPSTWPTVFLPFHMAPDGSAPTRMDELLIHVHFKGAGAAALRQFLMDALQEVDTERDKQGLELLAYLHWPFNVTVDGLWKEVSGMSGEDIEAWKKVKEEMGAAKGLGER
jgi:hypothetical protein